MLRYGRAVTDRETLAKRIYTTVYEIDSPEVLLSPEWAKYAEQGRWPTEVRPYTKNRSHAVYKVR